MTFHVSEQWGPFAPNLDPAERIARCRCLRTIAHLTLGPRGHPLADELQRAERNNVALEYALFGLNALAPKDRRQVWASYAALSKPV